MREERSEQSGENIPLLSLLYFVFVGQRKQTRLPVSVSHLFSTRNIDERIGSEADRELTVCSPHFDDTAGELRFGRSSPHLRVRSAGR